MDNATNNADRLTKANREFAIMMQTTAAKMAMLGSSVRDVGITLFNAFEKEIRIIIAALTLLVDAIGFVVKGFEFLPSPIKLATIAIGAFLAALGPLMLIIGTLATAAVSFGTAWTGLLGMLGATAPAAGAAGSSLATLGVTTATTTKTVGLMGTRFGSLLKGMGTGALAMGTFTIAIEGTKAAMNLFWESFLGDGQLEAFIHQMGGPAREGLSAFESILSGVTDVLWDVNNAGVSTAQQNREIAIEQFKLNQAQGEGAKVIETYAEALALKNKRLGEARMANIDAVKVETASAQAISETKEALEINLAAYRETQKATEDSAAAHKFLGAEVGTLSGLQIKLALDMKAAEEAAKKEEAAMKKLADSLKKLTVEFKVDEIEKTAKALQQVKGEIPISEIRKFVEAWEPFADRLGPEGIAMLAAYNAVLDEHQRQLIALVPVTKEWLDSLTVDLPTDAEIFDKAGGLKDLMGFPKGFNPLDAIREDLEKGLDPTDIGLPEGFKLGPSEEDIERTKRHKEAMKDLNNVIRGMADIADLFGGGAITTAITGVGSVLGGLGAIGEVGGLSKIFDQQGKDGIQGLISGMSSAIPIIGAFAGPFMSLIGSFFKSPGEKAAEEIGRRFGTDLSEELGDSIAAMAEDLDISVVQAGFLHLSDIIGEMGGVNSGNISQLTDEFRFLFTSVASGALPAVEGMEQIEEVFPQIIDGLRDMGVAGSIEIGKLVSGMQEAGIESEALNNFIKEGAQSILSDFTPALDLLNKQFSEGFFGEEELAAAESNLALMAATFHSAVAAAGSLGGAIALLPESFDQLIAKMAELFEGNNEAFNELQQYYNFAKENEEVLVALDGIISGMRTMAELGLLNANNINAMAEAARTQMEGLLASTEDQGMALRAMGPQIGELMQMYEEMGLAVPEWLQEMADKALAAGASLEPPEGIEDILGDIRDIMLDIAVAFGVASDEAGKFGATVGGLPSPSGGPPPTTTGPPTGFATGGSGVVSRPTLFLAGEAGEEGFEFTPGGLPEDGKGINVNVSGGLGTPEAIAEAVEDGVIRAIRDSENVKKEIREASS